jgi:hypothetical protein
MSNFVNKQMALQKSIVNLLEKNKQVTFSRPKNVRERF